MGAGLKRRTASNLVTKDVLPGAWQGDLHFRSIDERADLEIEPVAAGVIRGSNELKVGSFALRDRLEGVAWRTIGRYGQSDPGHGAER